MIENYMPIGFHLGSGGNPTGIGDYMRALDVLAIPASIMSADHYGYCFEMANVAAQSGNEHNIGFRFTTDDVPDYTLDPVVAAQLHWDNLQIHLPVEFDKERVWIMPINEPNKKHADWLGRFGVEYFNITNPLGYKISMFGWSTGEPEYGDWEDEGMIEFLHLCADNQDTLAIALHEYSLDVNNIQYGYPYLIGRFMFLHDLCDEYGLERPTLHISEWGWTYNNAPPVEQAMFDIAWAADLYSPYPNIKMANTWYLGSEYGGIANKVQPLIFPVTEFAKTYEAPTIPLPPEETLEEHIWRVSGEKQVLSLYPDAAFQKKLNELDKNIVQNELRTIYEGEEYGYQRGEGLTDGETVVVAAKVPDWNNIFIVEDPEDNPPEPGNPLTNLTLSPPFRLPFAVSSWFNDPRNYANGLHEGLDIVIPGQPLDSKEPVLNMYHGRVFKVRRATGAYYNYVVVEHENNGSQFFTWHAHLDDIFVVEGQPVAVGHLLGELGDTGGGWLEHDHIVLQVPGYGRGGYAVPDVVDPYPYMTNAVLSTYDLLDYLRGDGRVYDVRFMANDGSEHQERFQSQLGNGSIFYQTKNQHWEELWFDNQFIWRGTDTSPGQDKYYTLSDGPITIYGDGSRWIHRHVVVGDVYERNPLVTLYWKANCQIVSQGNHRTWIRVEAYHPTKTFYTGVMVDDVIELAWLATPAGPVLERYFYAKDYGLVGWEGGLGYSAVKVVYPPGTQPDNERETIHCL